MTSNRLNSCCGARSPRYPDLVDAHNTLGVALINQGRPHDALAVFLEAARLDPRSATANNNVANVLGELGRNEEALPYLQKVIDANPGLADARHNLGMLLQKLKRHEQAAASLEAALRLAPRAAYTLSSLVWNELAICKWEGLTAHVDALRTQVRRGEIPAEPFVARRRVTLSRGAAAVRGTARAGEAAAAPTALARIRGTATTGSDSPTCRPIIASMRPPISLRDSSSGTIARASRSSASPMGPTITARCGSG